MGDDVINFASHHWTDDALEGANDATAAAGGVKVGVFTGNEINALICEVQAWRRAFPERRYESPPNAILADKQ